MALRRAQRRGTTPRVRRRQIREYIVLKVRWLETVSVLGSIYVVGGVYSYTVTIHIID